MLQKLLDDLNRLTKRSEIDRRIELCQTALTLVSKEKQPELWGRLQDDLACSLIEKPNGVRVDNIEQAIYHFLMALDVMSRETHPEHWARTQNNLGITYIYRINGDQAENIEQAIFHLYQGLEVRTRQTFPNAWGETQNSLGKAYMARILGDREKNIERAIQYFEQSLQVRTREKFPEDWAQTMNDLARAYNVRSLGNRSKNLEKAIDYYQQALKIRTREAFPEEWALTLNNLASIYLDRSPVEQTEDVEYAIQLLEQALQVYTREAFPEDWASIQNNLATAYINRMQGEQVENIEKAIFYCKQTLEIYTPHSFPERCLNTAQALGNLACNGHRWELAGEAYTIALDAEDALIQGSFSWAGKQAILGKAQDLHHQSAYAYVKLGNIQEAVEILEKGRTQLLRESFELQQRNLDRLPALGFESLYEKYMLARNEYRSLQNVGTSTTTQIADWNQALNKLKNAATAIREQVSHSYPQYRYFMQTLPFSEIQKLILDKPLVYLCVATAGGLALIVSRQGVQAIEIPELQKEALQNQIWQPVNEDIDRINTHLQQGVITHEDIQAVRGGYFSIYALRSTSYYYTSTSEELIGELHNAWLDTLDKTTHWLWDVVMGKLMPVLKEYGSATLIPTGQLAILPLHAAWQDDLSMPTHRRYVLDEINISYAPSAHALWQAQLASERPAETLMVVENPDGSLKFSRDEARAALDMFKKSVHLRGKDATIKAVKEGMTKAEVLHFSTHGNAGWRKAVQAQLLMADGSLTLPDIFALDLSQARLAVLSADETGVPSLELLDEMIGLPSGFMQAGVPGVIGSLWSVNEMSTALLMARFYEYWKKEEIPPQEALRRAQIWLRDNLFESPFYWAAFTYFGV